MNKKKRSPDRILFQLEALTKVDLKRASLKNNSGNVSGLINMSLKWFIHCIETKDKGLEKFLAEKLHEAEAKLEK